MLHVKPPHGLKDHRLAIGTLRSKPRHGGREGVGRNIDRDFNSRVGRARVVNRKRNLTRFTRGNVDTPNVALRPIDNGVAIGRPGHGGIGALNRPGFLHVGVEIINQHGLLA